MCALVDGVEEEEADPIPRLPPATSSSLSGRGQERRSGRCFRVCVYRT